MGVETVVLGVERAVQEAPAEAGAREVGGDERGETDVAVGEVWRGWAGELEFVGFEGEDGGFLGGGGGVFGVDDFADEGRVVFRPAI